MNFWDAHGIWFAICLFFFPRLTMFFGGIATGGVLWWLGWFLVPRLLVAVIATMHYRHTNPMLVAFTWIWAIGGELGEKNAASKASS